MLEKAFQSTQDVDKEKPQSNTKTKRNLIFELLYWLRFAILSLFIV